MMRFSLFIICSLLVMQQGQTEELPFIEVVLSNGVRLYHDQSTLQNACVLATHPSGDEVYFSHHPSDALPEFFNQCLQEIYSWNEHPVALAVMGRGVNGTVEFQELVDDFFGMPSGFTFSEVFPFVAEGEEAEGFHSEYELIQATMDLPILKCTDGEGNSFLDLPLDPKEAKLIEEIIKTMADKNVFQLALEKKTMEKKGRKVNHVHPMRFIGYICSQQNLKNALRTVKKSSFKWDAFISGFSGRMKEELSRQNILPHVQGMANVLHLNPNELMPYIQNRDWEGFVKYLISH